VTITKNLFDRLLTWGRLTRSCWLANSNCLHFFSRHKRLTSIRTVRRKQFGSRQFPYTYGEPYNDEVRDVVVGLFSPIDASTLGDFAS